MVQNPNIWKVPVPLIVIQPVAYDEYVGNPEPKVVERAVFCHPALLEEKRNRADRCGAMAGDGLFDHLQSAAGIDDVLDDKHVFVRQLGGGFQIDRDMSRRYGFRTIAVCGNEVELDIDTRFQLPHQVGRENETASEHGNHDECRIRIVRGNLLSKFGNSGGDSDAGYQRMSDGSTVHIHFDPSLPEHSPWQNPARDPVGICSGLAAHRAEVFHVWELRPRDRNVAGMTIPELRAAAKRIWQASLEAAHPDVCIPRALESTGRGFRVGGKEYTVPGRLIVIGAGKAGAGMAQAVEGILGERVSTGLVITKYGHRLPTRRIEVLEAGHPVPDRAGELAVGRMRQILDGLSPADVVLCLISGGGSSLLPAPAPGISLEQKQEVTSRMLRAGADIRELNAVRKHLSAIKGGQLMEWAAPAQVVSLIMSDVIGDPLDFIASGPTAPDTTTFADALGIVRKYEIDIPEPVLKRLESGSRGDVRETPKFGNPIFDRSHNHIVANNRLLTEVAAAKARELGFGTLVLSSEIEGEAREVGRLFASVAREIGSSGNPLNPPACILAAGETTVTVRGRGRGGRNQEMALAWAVGMRDWPHPVCFASVATDGTDGPTDAAGGLVDPLTCSRSIELNHEPMTFLRANDSFTFLDAVGDLIVTGPTHTNLMDLQILLAG